jgi:hypothetical protein
MDLPSQKLRVDQMEPGVWEGSYKDCPIRIWRERDKRSWGTVTRFTFETCGMRRADIRSFDDAKTGAMLTIEGKTKRERELQREREWRC